ncbi:MAG TPA: lamin tail domain-containing protein [Bacteroidales bacterium]|nr:lamin tail domain-containing protein [Bacteroidales bacterium]
MKKVIFVLIFIPYLASSQIVDDFESGKVSDWVQYPEGRWKAENASAISGSFSLHHVFDNTESGNDRVAQEIRYIHPDEGSVIWSFSIKHGYDPSSTNNWAVFLVSEQDPVNMFAPTCNAYLIGVNISGSDDTLRLVRMINGNNTNVVNCGINWQTDIGITTAARISVTRNASGVWKVEIFKITGELLKASEGTSADLPDFRWFGIAYRYSSTKDRLLWIDDVLLSGVFYQDTIPPSVKEYNISGNNSIEICLSEEPSEGTMTAGLFTLENGASAISVEKLSSLKYNIVFADDFSNKKRDTLYISGLCDITGNCSDRIGLDFMALRPDPGDIIISEIMADPVPSVSLPEAEYIEITNLTDYSFNTKNWTVQSGDQSYLFTERVLKPREIVILCHKSDTLAFCKYGSVYGFSSFPALPDNSRLISISDSAGILVHGVEYSQSWYNNDLKSEGGWSLEIIDPDFPFYYEDNWTASSSKTGGTPGKKNSASEENRDISFKGLINTFPEDSLHLTLTFSEPVNYTGNSVKPAIEKYEVLEIHCSDKLFRSFYITVNKPFLPGEVNAVIFPEGIHDFAGNEAEIKEFKFGLTEQATNGDILFNEILFNSIVEGTEYIEFYNSSDKVIDASRLFLVSVSENGDTSDLLRVSEEHRCILPSTHYAITEKKEDVEQCFISGNSEFIFSVNDFPSLPDAKGHLLLLNRELDFIDEVLYDEKMHYSLLDNKSGISLEKTDPLLSSIQPDNWHSASATSGGGTPGSQNSVYQETPVTEEEIVLSSSKITPDSDGIDDILTIRMNFPGDGYIVSASVFDETGSLKKRIASNLLAGPSDTIIWDGTADDGSALSSGIYIIFVTYYNDAGETGRWKKICTVLR